ncbi:glycoside hydrolase family 3 N-terminal domain-containing protein [Rhodoluna sp.]|uniref:glycoside hydrolase family 3 protein n=1 Tax=Rhodoluna sp. TaxID=1969481 RepID=UPI0025F8F08A|nr:glycoside hydrolase family 3 N-terminal domain-containing protein [Rhodoluna sp.]
MNALPYQDPKLTVAERVADLLPRLSLEDKAGLMFHEIAPMLPGGELLPSGSPWGVATEELIRQKRITHFNVHGVPKQGSEMARWHNKLQSIAAEVGLGVPVTISTDPRHAFAENQGALFSSGAFSQWPESLAFSAIGDLEVVEQFGDIARQEYRAVGIHASLHPQIDLATEPRWARSGMTFGEDAKQSGAVGAAYIRGFQGKVFGKSSVSTMTKHFPGGGPQLDGEDPHFEYGKEQVYPGNNFDYHVEPFKDAIAAGTRAMMPYYGQPIGTKYEEVGFGFNKGVLTDLLKGELGFEGIICTDWGLITDANILGQDMPARAWGVEHLSRSERVEKAINAGSDQFGGESCPELIVELVREGRISEERINYSAAKLLAEKFILGLFDEERFVDEAAADAIVGKPEFLAAGEAAQRAGYVLLKLAAEGAAQLPLPAGLKIYVEGLDADKAGRLGQVVGNPAEADLAIVRKNAHFDPRPGGFEAIFHAGSLEFPSAEVARIVEICKTVPTIFDIYLDRAAVFPEIAEAAAVVTANFGSNPNAFMDVLQNPKLAKGRLPIELPSSLEAILASKSDVPYDTASPTFAYGAGLSV